MAKMIRKRVVNAPRFFVPIKTLQLPKLPEGLTENIPSWRRKRMIWTKMWRNIISKPWKGLCTRVFCSYQILQQPQLPESLTPMLSQVWTGEMSLLRHKIEISESEKENIPSSRRKRMIWTKMWRKTSQTEIWFRKLDFARSRIFQLRKHRNDRIG